MYTVQQYKKIIIKKKEEKKEEEDGDNKYDDYCRVLGEKDLQILIAVQTKKYNIKSGKLLTDGAFFQREIWQEVVPQSS